MQNKLPVIIIAIVILAATLLIIILLVVKGSNNQEPDIDAQLSSIAESMNTTTEATTETTTETTTVTTTVTTTETTTEATPAPLEVETESGELVMLDSIKSYYNSNSDTAGWIKVGGTFVDDVVVQTDNNDFYLDHSFQKSYYSHGAIFADFRGKINDYAQNQCDNIMLYGHNQADGSMFGTLSRYKISKQNTSNFDFYKEHPTFEFSNLYHTYTYKIIGIMVVEVEDYQVRPDDEVFDYQNYVKFFPDNEKYNFDNWYKNVMERTEVLTGVECDPTDKYLTLSTCSNEFDQSRLLIIGRRVRQDEDPEVDTSLAKLNPDAKEPDLAYIYGR